MGNTLHTYEHVAFLRFWTAAQTNEVIQTLRWKRATLVVLRRTFEDLIENRKENTIKVWESLDADFDGKVDTFEVLAALILWSDTNLAEKKHLLFRCFDFNRKGKLRIAELTFMLVTLSRVLKCFVELEAGLLDVAKLKQHAESAFNGFKDKSTAELDEDSFGAWFDRAWISQQLADFLQSHIAGNLPDAAEAPVQKDVRMREYRVEELLARIDAIKKKLETVDGETLERGELQQKEFDVLKRRLATLLLKLDRAGETVQKELVELSTSMQQTVSASGPAALMEPSVKFRHDQLLAELALLEKRAQDECSEASELVRRLLDLTFGSAETRLPTPPAAEVPEPEEPGVVDKQRAERVARNRVIDRKVRKHKGIKSLPKSEDATKWSKLVVVFADFDPPTGTNAKMLRLREGEEIMATMRESGGWWWGRMIKTHEEGWFPPTYVDLKEAE